MQKNIVYNTSLFFTHFISSHYKFVKKSKTFTTSCTNNYVLVRIIRSPDIRTVSVIFFLSKLVECTVDGQIKLGQK
jgi:hypothetical protein